VGSQTRDIIEPEAMEAAIADGEIFHKWLGDVLENFDLPSNILCWKMTGTPPALVKGAISVTMENRWMNCQECNEWLHA
jgi:hypothetical protein